MMLVGTSLQRCLISLMRKEVLPEDVLVIITRTDCRDKQDLLNVVESYYKRMLGEELREFDLDSVINMANHLWEEGKIHQPRIFTGYSGYSHVELSVNETWLAIAPSPKTDEKIVVDAYEKYLVLRKLMA